MDPFLSTQAVHRQAPALVAQEALAPALPRAVIRRSVQHHLPAVLIPGTLDFTTVHQDIMLNR